MAEFRLGSILQLARELDFAPNDVRALQLARAEELLHIIDPAKAYPLDFIIFRITEYRPKVGGDELLTGLALQHDLGLLIEQVSDGLNMQTSALAEPVLTIADVCARFDVTSKTIQRWRRRGLPARRFIFADGKRRVGFLLGSVERFLANHGEQLPENVNLSQVSPAEAAQIVGRAAHLAAAGCTVELIARRLARRMHRSPLAILHTLVKHDQEQPRQAVLRLAAPPVADADRAAVLAAYEGGASIAQLARNLGRPRAVIYNLLLDERIKRVADHRVRFHDDPLFHQPDAESVIAALVSAEELTKSPPAEELRVPRQLPAELAELYRTPLLSLGKERALFLKYNFHKYQFAAARRQLDEQVSRNRDLIQLEGALAKASAAREAIARANLRLVVSVAKRHLRPGVSLTELMSDGTVVLMRAVDGFDIAKGNRFSTYATLALMKGFARGVPQLIAAAKLAAPGQDQLETLPDSRPALAHRLLLDRDEVSDLLSRLTDRERHVVRAHFGLEANGHSATQEELGQRLGLSRERVKQIEQTALDKLRAALHPSEQ